MNITLKHELMVGSNVLELVMIDSNKRLNVSIYIALPHRFDLVIYHLMYTHMMLMVVCL